MKVVNCEACKSPVLNACPFCNSMEAVEIQGGIVTHEDKTTADVKCGHCGARWCYTMKIQWQPISITSIYANPFKEQP